MTRMWPEESSLLIMWTLKEKGIMNYLRTTKFDNL